MTDSRRALIVLLACVGITAASSAMSDAPASQCGIEPLREGVLPGIPNLRLGEPVAFDDGMGIDAGLCARLLDGDEFVTWVHAYHQVGSRLFVQRCETTEPSVPTDSGSVSGAVSQDFVELVLKRARAEFRALPAPMWSAFSNPAFCRSHMAYWGAEFPDNQPMVVHAVVYDLIGERVVKDAILGSKFPESDSRDFFEQPQWSADGGKVFFPGHENGALDGDTPIESHQFDLEQPGQ